MLSSPAIKPLFFSLYLSSLFSLRLPLYVCMCVCMHVCMYIFTRADVHHQQARVKELNLSDKVTFMPSFTNRERVEILQRCLCLVYTPRGEHFGIVPIEVPT